MIASNELINKGNNDVMFKITKLEVEARREANASQERIATMFAAILAKNVPPT